MSSLSERIAELSAGLGRGWQAKLAKHCGIKPPSVADWLSGKTKKLEGQNLVKAAEFFNVMPQWLATGKGKKYANASSQTPQSITGEGSAISSDFDANIRFVPQGKRPYPVISAVQAGMLKEITDPYAPGDGFDIEYGDDEWSKWTFALEIEGESMLPDFRPGDRVIVDPELTPRPGEFVVAKNIRDEATFKKYRVRGLNENGEQVFELVPLNPDFETMRSDLQPLVVIGVMVEHRKRYRR